MKPQSALKRTRIKLGLTQAEVAERVGVTIPTVCLLEQKGIKRVSTAKKYSAAMSPHVAPADVMDW